METPETPATTTINETADNVEVPEPKEPEEEYIPRWVKDRANQAAKKRLDGKREVEIKPKGESKPELQPGSEMPAKDLTKPEPEEEKTPTKEAKKETEKKEEKVEVKKDSKEPKIYAEKVKAVIDGEEKEYTVKELLTRAQKGEAAEKRLEEAARIRKAADAMAEKLVKEPKDIFKRMIELGHMKKEDYQKFLEDELYGIIQDEALDPKDREIKELKHKVQLREAEDAKKKEAADQAAIEEMAATARTEIESEIVTALEDSELPRDPYVVGRVAYYIKKGMVREPPIKITAAQAVKLVRKDLEEQFTHMYGKAEGDKLLTLLGKETAAKIRKAEIAALKSEGKTVGPKSDGPISREAKKKMTMEEWKERNRKRMAEL